MSAKGQRERWKNSERAIACRLGGTRVPVTGRARGSAPDVAHPVFAIECKSRQTIPAWLHEAMAQARASVRGEQLPIAVLHEVGTRHAADLVVIRLDDFRQWFGDLVPEGSDL